VVAAHIPLARGLASGGGGLWLITTRTPDLQKGKLLSQGCALPLGLFSSLASFGRIVDLAQEFCLDHILGLVRNRKLTLEKGDLPNRLIGLPMSRSR
jgi:hypothetical protein